MADWTSGYVADLGYTHGYYKELNPNRMALAFLNAGFSPPSTGLHCELGFGQGLSVNVHAAASGSIWYANDFNPSQAAFAQSLASASGAEAHLTDEAFVDFCNRVDLPEFDTIGLHGIWSWISDANREAIVDFIRRKLKVGGGLYISYNTMPGWSSFVPVRHLLTEHSTTQSNLGSGTLSRIENALNFAEKLFRTHPQFVKSNPSIVDRLEKFREQNPQYLAHEFFNKDWHPMPFSKVAEHLSAAKVDYVCSAHYMDFIDLVNLTKEQSQFLQEINDLRFKETIRDFMVNQQFRRDYWIKGPLKLSHQEQSNLIRAHRVVMISPQIDVELKISGSAGKADLSSSIYTPILEFLSDHEIRNIDQISNAVSKFNINFEQVVQAIIILMGAGYLDSAQTEAEIEKALPLTNKLNRKILEQSISNSYIACLSSPITGGGVAVDRIQQLFLVAMRNGNNDSKDWVDFVWKIFVSQNQRLIKEKKSLLSDEENLNELNLLVQNFLTKSLPLFKKLKVI
jgi:hypothetical protein